MSVCNCHAHLMERRAETAEAEVASLKARLQAAERYLNQIIVERGCKYRDPCESLPAYDHPKFCAVCSARRFLGAKEGGK